MGAGASVQIDEATSNILKEETMKPLDASDVATLLINSWRTVVQVSPDTLVPNLVVKTLFSESTVYNTYWPASVVAFAIV